METLENLKKSLETSKSIRKVITTMKALSGANIKKYENAVKVLFDYKNCIEIGFQAILMNDHEIKSDFLTGGKNNLYIIFGSNQGLCGRFNDRILEFLKNNLKQNKNTKILVVGERLNMILEEQKFNISKTLPIPNTIENIPNTIYEILNSIEEEKKNNLGKVVLYYTKNDDNANNTVTKERLMPSSKKFLKNLKNKPWVTKNIPFWRVNTDTLISDLLTQYMFTLINNALINSITSELKNRLITLQNAENNISELIKIKTLEYNQKRQETITSELLDVVSGYQVSKNKISQRFFD